MNKLNPELNTNGLAVQVWVHWQVRHKVYGGTEQ